MLPAQSGLTRDNGRVSASFNGRMSGCHASLPQPKKTPTVWCMCASVDGGGMTEIKSLADVRALVSAWDGQEPLSAVWNLARLSLESRAAAPADADAEMRHQQEEAARSRLVEELGRMLIRFE